MKTATTQKTDTPNAPRPRGGIAPHKYGFVISASINGKSTYLGFRKTRTDAETALNFWRDNGKMPAKPERAPRATAPANPRPKRAKTATMSSKLSPRGKRGTRALPGDNDAVKRARAKLAAASLKTSAAEMEAIANNE